MKKYKVKDIMVRNPVFVKPESSLRDAACVMKKVNCGILLVGTKEKLDGIITDRDLVTRALINGDHHEEEVRDYMTPEVFCCNEDDTLKQAAEIMQECKVNRLIVQDKNRKFTGLLSIGDILNNSPKGADVGKMIKNCLCDKI